MLALPYFHAVADGVALGEAFQGYNDISAVLMRVARQWRDSGVLTGWRDENFTAHDLDGRPCFELERAAFRAFGLQSRAVHINGLVRNADGSWCMWVARRSPLKSVEPDKLDNLTGGGVAAGETLKAALLREGQEEAGLAPVWLSPLSALAPVFACRHVRRVEPRQQIGRGIGQFALESKVHVAPAVDQPQPGHGVDLLSHG